MTRGKINFRMILHTIGRLLLIVGAFMLTGIPFSLYYHSGDEWVLLLSSVITMAAGITMFFTTRRNLDRNLGKREGYIIVTITWIIISAFGTLPYLLSGTAQSFTDAFFETISGFSTTGASILTDVEVVPKGVLFWRSMTHWIGGMGIIVLSVAILPFLGTGGMQLFNAEASGPVKDKLHPRIQSTAKNLWGIYILFTFVQTILLIFGGMNLFDALCHSFGTMATGGFSTRNASLGAYSPFCQYVVIVFMIIASINFALHYFTLRGQFRKVARDEELKMYIVIIMVTGLFIWGSLMYYNGSAVEKTFRESFFQVASIISCTGFATSDYTLWPTHLWMILFLLMFFGGCAGSTSGSIKIIRHLVLFKTGAREFRKIVHPNAVIPVRYNGTGISEDVIFKILAFFFLYLLIFATSSLFLTISGVDFESAIGSVATTMGGIGPGLNKVGPMGNYHDIPGISKWVLSFCMLAGRLEIFSVIILFTPSFWKK